MKLMRMGFWAFLALAIDGPTNSWSVLEFCIARMGINSDKLSAMSGAVIASMVIGSSNKHAIKNQR